ncbi:MAG: hypothetical protein HFJ91_01670 [Muribaculaceae bacterium]|nr:hypothetical protein [Muribaculaceae bacterium]
MKTAKWDKPLSRRAYEKIKEKALIGVTIAGRELDFEEFEETIDIYIEKGKVVLPWCDHHDIYDIIFHMIKDDIDTAMRRSREARERAAARRKAREEDDGAPRVGDMMTVGSRCGERQNCERRARYLPMISNSMLTRVPGRMALKLVCSNV